MNSENKSYGSGCLIQVVAVVLWGVGSIFVALPFATKEDDIPTSFAAVPIGLAVFAIGVFLFWTGYKRARK